MAARAMGAGSIACRRQIAVADLPAYLGPIAIRDLRDQFLLTALWLASHRRQ
jgi:hypothetical protein